MTGGGDGGGCMGEGCIRIYFGASPIFSFLFFSFAFPFPFEFLDFLSII